MCDPYFISLMIIIIIRNISIIIVANINITIKLLYGPGKSHDIIPKRNYYRFN